MKLDTGAMISVTVKLRKGLLTAVMNSPECWRWIFLFCSSSQWRCPCSAPALAVIAPVPWVASSYLKQLNYWLSLCDWGGVTRHTGTDADTAKAEPHSSSRPHWKYYLSLYNSLNPILLGLPVCESLFTLKRFPISHYTWWIQFTIQRMSNLALHFAGFLLSEKEEYCFKQLQTATLAS